MNYLELYQVANDYKQALDELPALDLPEEAIKDTLEGLAGTLEEKVVQSAAYIKNLEAHVETVNNAIDELVARKQVMQCKADKLKKALARIMQSTGIKSVKSPLYDVTSKTTPPSVLIIDDAAIPSEYIREVIKRDINKKAIKEDLKAGKEITGCSLQQDVCLQIK